MLSIILILYRIVLIVFVIAQWTNILNEFNFVSLSPFTVANGSNRFVKCPAFSLVSNYFSCSHQSCMDAGINIIHRCIDVLARISQSRKGGIFSGTRLHKKIMVNGDVFVFRLQGKQLIFFQGVMKNKEHFSKQGFPSQKYSNVEIFGTFGVRGIFQSMTYACISTQYIFH